VTAAASRLSPLVLRGLYAITPDRLGRQPQRLCAAVEAALEGGAALIQYRDKSSDAAARRRLGQDLLKICRRHQKPLLINDDPELAAELGADGVHLGLQDAPLEQARRRLGANAIIGVTCGNSLERAQAAQDQGASYVSFGRFFDSRTKPQAPPADISVLQAARKVIEIPICAIGGITPDNARPLLQAGADLLAAVGGVFDAPDIAAAASAYRNLF
jgi:thiamine-phosphate pyrophosphorylase